MSSPAILMETTCERCLNRESNREARRQCDQHDLDEILESVNRLKFIARTLWELDGLDREEKGTVSIMLRTEAEKLFETMCNLETRLGE